MKLEQREKQASPSLADKVIAFVRASGLRRKELEALRVRDVVIDEYDDGVYILISDEQSQAVRRVPTLIGSEELILSLVENRADDELVFPSLPKGLRLHPWRREYARWLGEELLDLTGEQELIILGVMNALNETRAEVVKRYYLRDVHFSQARH